jgi:hypothetical protein
MFAGFATSDRTHRQETTVFKAAFPTICLLSFAITACAKPNAPHQAAGVKARSASAASQPEWAVTKPPPSPAPQAQSHLPQMLAFDFSAGPPLPQGVQDNAVEVVNHGLVSVGGFCHGYDDDWKPGMYPRGFLAKTWALDLENQADGWQPLPDFPGHPRQGMYAAAVDDALYVWGGFSYDKPYTYKDGYKLHRSDGAWHWTRLPDLIHPGALGSTVAIGTRIYILGGMDYAKKYYVQTDRTGKIERFGARFHMFDTARPDQGWQILTPCPGTPRALAGLAAAKNKIYAMGGYGVDRQNKAHCVVDSWRYDPAQKAWSRLRDLPVAVAGFGTGRLAFRDRYILLITGYPFKTILNPDGSTRPRYGEASAIDRSQWKQHPRLKGQKYENHNWVYDTQTNLYGTATTLPYDDHTPPTLVLGNTVYMFPNETAGFWWEGEYFGHAPEFVLKAQIRTLDWPDPTPADPNAANSN